MSGGKVISLANHNIKPSSRHLSSSLRRSTSLGTESSFQFLGVQERREASTMMTSSVCSLVLLKYSLIFTVLLLVTVKIPPCEGGSVEDYHRRYGERARAAWLAATQHRRDMRRLGGASHRRSDVSRDLQVHPTSHHRHSREVHESADEYLSHQSLGRHRRHVDGSGRGSSTARGGKYGHALLFTGDAQVLRLKPSGRNVAFEIPKNDFTVEFWLKPEGGQLDEVPIVGVFDTCVTETGQRHPGTWQIGIKATRKNERKDARIFFSLYTERSRKGTLLTSSRNYIPEKWVHVAAVYANHKMKFYLDGAKVATDTTQRGDIFSEPYHRCKQFEIGGDAIAKRYFRGSLDEIRLWRKGLHHSEIVRQMFEGKTTARHQNLVISSNFNTLTGWELEDGHNEPLRVYSTIDDHRFDMALTTPPCGRTVCDDPDVVRSYVAHPELRAPKELRYRLINVYDDDGTNPSVSSSQILEQHAMLQDAFLRYDISWTYEVKVVKSSSMRKRKVLRECDPAKIGDNKCDRNCNFTTTGYDGGDCLSLPCDQEQIGNHYCDLNCNQYRYGWDGGDCCETGDRGHCIDPESPHRTYLTLSEYKSMLNISSKSHLNVFVPELIAASILGQATYPWEKGALEEQGGVVIDASRYGRPGFMSTLVHEVGHVLGLLHVHHGVSDLRCDDQCAESRPSLELGDLCSDTNPTPMNSKCRDPDEVTCSGTVYKNTPYRNYMSYAEGDNCTDHFTPQQVARLHCYADLRYGTWMTGREPSPIPIAPRILNTAADTVTLAWIPPLNTQNGDDVSQYCSLCHQDDSLGQYATSATSSNPGNLTVMVTPDEVLGAPDADRCTPSQGIWFSEQDFCDMDCFIDVGFSVPVIPTRLLLWVTWNTVDAIADVELHFIDGTTVSLGPITVFCDMPFTTHLDVNQKVNKVRIYTSKPWVGIDAVELVSKPNHPNCTRCRPLKYKVYREPSFPDEAPAAVDECKLIDRSVAADTNYTYRIQAIVDGKGSALSPAISYVHGSPFCGDGHLDSNEQCDDGNAADGDGCSIDCMTEEFFKCRGSPSLCYRHDGDGVCEDFEKQISVEDCGYYTPPGHFDQWAAGAVANPVYQRRSCPESVVIGPPTHPQVCGPEIDPVHSWYPCGGYGTGEQFWLKVSFQRPAIASMVIVYIGSDGLMEYSREVTTINVELIDENGELHPVGHKEVELRCRDNPVEIGVQHDLSKPFFKTKGVLIKFTSPNVAIAAVRLRSSKHLDPITISQCTDQELYNPSTGRCSAYSCTLPVCGQYTVENAEVHCTGTEDGDTCDVTCHDGYTLSRSHQEDIVCVAGVWTGRDLMCVPIQCGEPRIRFATSVCPDGTSFGNQCIFNCNPPALLRGTDNTVTCDSDGLWSLPVAYCQVKCPRPPSPTNAMLATVQCKENELDPGTKCKFRCQRGYHVTSMAKSRRTFHKTCMGDGSWFGADCDKVTCDPPGLQYYGLYACTDRYDSGSSCTMKCPDEEPRPSWTGRTSRLVSTFLGYFSRRSHVMTSTITCQNTGHWDKDFAPCTTIAGHCPMPVDDQLDIFCNGTSVGSTCNVSCKGLYHDPVLLGKPQRHLEGYIGERNVVRTLTCTGGLTWQPEITTIRCMEQCILFSVGNGYCDPENNREHCNWDGGDCCPSTVEGGFVMNRPLLCGDLCRCLDPRAKENRQSLDASKRQRASFANMRSLGMRGY